MAITKAKRSIHPSKAGRRSSPKAKPKHKKQKTRSSISPGELALRERTLPGRRFVEFPLIKGKVVERVQLFTTTNDNSLTIELQDQTSLVLDIEPGFTIHAQLMRLEKGDLNTLAEWPPIKNTTDR